MKAVYRVEGKSILKDPIKGITIYDKSKLEEELVSFMTRYGVHKLEARLVEAYEPKKKKEEVTSGEH